MVKKFVYYFGQGEAEGTGAMKDLLGGKGAGLAEMTRIGLPVPPGFTISTEACNAYYASSKQFPEGMWEQVLEALKRVEDITGKRFGDAANPLLVSVRSGAKFSMPGMMDTVLNLGLNDDTVRGLAALTGDERFAYDAYRRFIQMFGRIVMGVPAEKFDRIFEQTKKRVGAKLDTGLDARHLKQICEKFKQVVTQHSGEPFPASPYKQLELAIRAVFASWFGKRAVDYRRINKIPDDLGTAVNVVTMVFGNMGENSGTGVAFTRNPSSGAKELYGEYLPNAQGEDVVAGIRTPLKIAQLKQQMPEIYAQLAQIAELLERHYKDVQDIEFTVERGKLWMLQTRTAKRTAYAAVVIAVDMVREGLIDKATALTRVDAYDLAQLFLPRVDPTAKLQVLARGLSASPGAASGRVVFDPDRAVALAAQEDGTILVRVETSPDDYHGMVAAGAIVTARGGLTSHAAVVARGMGKTCVVGCEELRIDYSRRLFSANGVVVREGTPVTVDGHEGRVILGKAPIIDSAPPPQFAELMKWADEHRRLRVRANADTPEDARVARAAGAEGIGLCRTEHMFFAGDRIDYVRLMILGSAEYKRLEGQIKSLEGELARKLPPERRRQLQGYLKEAKEAIKRPGQFYLGSLKRLLPMQRSDFIGIFRAMSGYPVTIRTLDPPLHEFLPSSEKEIRELAARLVARLGGGRLSPSRRRSEVKKLAAELWSRARALHEFNPMLGHRGCRLGIIYPEITEMQTRAIFEAAVKVKREKHEVYPEIMIPLVSDLRELELQVALVRHVADEVMREAKIKIPYLVGTMIELPRAALTADAIAREAEFFSFGTNDLTQTTMGLSRDDAAKFLPYYIENKVFKEDPFQVLDEAGVGQLIKIGVERGRASRPQLKVGICGEHGGDPKSIAFCHRAGLDYVSCSPGKKGTFIYRARLAAAQAAVEKKEEYSTA